MKTPLFEVKKGGKTYYSCAMFEPPAKAHLLELLEAGYQPYLNGKRVSKASLKTKNDP
ncbi:MAG: hypothetical protein LUE61_07150 [Clostridiales bacterium]|nr:hypothetical protein [Clostridiales bacterium]